MWALGTGVARTLCIESGRVFECMREVVGSNPTVSTELCPTSSNFLFLRTKHVVESNREIECNHIYHAVGLLAQG